MAAFYDYRPIIVEGRQVGNVVYFDKGAELPAHEHNKMADHITIIVFGRFKLLGDRNGETVSAQSGGTIINWTEGERHGFKAETEGATLVNMFKRQMP
jgi:quercetin dioxygenase-like cupin family protein